MTRAEIIQRARDEFPYAVADDPLPATELGESFRTSGDRRLATAIDFLVAIGSVDSEDELVPSA